MASNPSNDDDREALSEAMKLLERVIELLDQAGAALPAAHAQHALDSCLRHSPIAGRL